MKRSIDSFESRATLQIGSRQVDVFRLDAVKRAGLGDPARLPYSIRVLLENLLRHEDGTTVTKEDIAAVAGWDPKATPSQEIAFRPSACSFRTSRAFRPSSTSRRCARPLRASEAIRHASILFSPRTWSSTIPSRWTATGSSAPSRTTSASSSSAIRSAISS